MLDGLLHQLSPPQEDTVYSFSELVYGCEQESLARDASSERATFITTLRSSWNPTIVYCSDYANKAQ